MCARRCAGVVLAVAVLIAVSPSAWAQIRKIDPQHSNLTVHVSRSGVFSFMGDDHDIKAPILQGAVDESHQSVSISVKANQLRVLDPKLAPDKREEVQRRMLGPDVLDVERYPEIDFRSSRTRAEEGQLVIEGLLTLHGQTQPVTVQVKGGNGSYTGVAVVKQTRFGIKPVTVGAGTVRVKDEVHVQFNIATVQ